MVRLDSTTLCRGMTIIDLGTGLPGALIAKLFVEAGATVTRIVAGRDPFERRYPAYPVWQRGKKLVKTTDLAPQTIQDYLAGADLVILGGEDHPDAVPLPSGRALAALHPRLVVLEIEGDPAQPGTPAVELLAQARSGFSYEHSEARPIHFAFPLASYGAALQGMIAGLAALCEREESGLGQYVGTSLLEGGMMWCAPLWFEAERADRALLADIPRDVPPLVFRCADGRFIHFMMGTPGAVKKLYEILAIDDPTVDPNDRGMPTGYGPRHHFWGNTELFQSHIIKFGSDELLAKLWEAGMGAERVEPPGACWSHPQVAHNGILATAEDGTRYVGFPIAPKTTTAGRPIAPRLTDRDLAGRGPLAGLRVLDLGSFVAGPYLSVVLGDLGADVVKIESPTGDVNRALLRAFACTNRGKRSLCLDKRTAAGAQILRRACLWADVVHHNSRPGVSTKLGVDAPTLQALRPEIIVQETSGYGATGPEAQHAGFDMMFQALCGHEFRGSGEGDVPLWIRCAIVDFGAGMLGAIGVLFAVLARYRGRQPPAVFVNLLDTGLFLMSELIRTPSGDFLGAPRMNLAQTGAHPAERLYQAADGWVAVVARGDTMARQLVTALALSTTITRPVDAWNEADGDAIATAIATRTVSEIAALLTAAGVWFEPCDPHRRDRALADPKLHDLGIVLRTDDPRYGDFRQIGPAFRFGRTPTAKAGRGRIPALGEHGGEIMRMLGYEPSEIEEFRTRKVIA